MFTDENHVTHLTTRVIEMQETNCEICDRPIQYHPDHLIPVCCDTCLDEGLA